MKRLLPPVLVLMIALAGCSAAEQQAASTPTPTKSYLWTSPTPTPTVAPTPTRTSTPTPTTAPAAPVSTIPSPDADQEFLLRAYLNEVDLALVGDERVVSRSRDTCVGILEPQSEETLIRSVKLRFEEPPEFLPTDEQAAAILAGIRSSGWCVAS